MKAKKAAPPSKPLKRAHEKTIEEESDSDSESMGTLQVKRLRRPTLFDNDDETTKNSKETYCFPQQKEEKLVEFFVKNECFYNKSDVKYTNKTYRTKRLQDLATELHTTGKNLIYVFFFLKKKYLHITINLKNKI